jgi:hypothetical protein
MVFVWAFPHESHIHLNELSDVDYKLRGKSGERRKVVSVLLQVGQFLFERGYTGSDLGEVVHVKRHIKKLCSASVYDPGVRALRLGQTSKTKRVKMWPDSRNTDYPSVDDVTVSDICECG